MRKTFILYIMLGMILISTVPGLGNAEPVPQCESFFGTIDFDLADIYYEIPITYELTGNVENLFSKAIGALEIENLWFNDKEIKPKTLYWTDIDNAWSVTIPEQNVNRQTLPMYWEWNREKNCIHFESFSTGADPISFSLPIETGRVTMTYRIHLPNGELTKQYTICWIQQIERPSAKLILN